MTSNLALILFLGFSAGAAAQQRPPPPPQPPGVPAGTQPPAAAETTDRGTATALILGEVLDARTRRPIARAIVTLAAGSRDEHRLTDDRGRFVFKDLRPGVYALNVMKNGYFDSTFGRRRASGEGTTLKLADGQLFGDAQILMWKPGSVSGRVVDEAGEPVVGITMRATRREIGGRLGATSFDVTDDRGIYRIPMMMPGDYVVSVPSTQVTLPVPLTDDGLLAKLPIEVRGFYNISGASIAEGGIGAADAAYLTAVGRLAPPPPGATGDRPHVYPTLHYAASTSIREATAVSVVSGTERSGIDFQLAPVPTMTVSGSIHAPDGRAGHLPLRLLVDAGLTGPGTDVAVTISNDDGTFTFLNVPAGSYFVEASYFPATILMSNPTATITQTLVAGVMMTNSRTGESTAPVPDTTGAALFARVPVTVSESPVNNLLVSLQPVPSIRGRVTFSGTAPKPAPDVLARMTMGADRRGGGQAAPGAFLHADGMFDLPVPPGEYFLVLSSVPSTPPRAAVWTLSSIAQDGRDLIDAVVEIDSKDMAGVVFTLTDRPPVVSGTVSSSQGGPATAATVLAFPAERALGAIPPPKPRRWRQIRVSDTGSYTLSDLPPGDYYFVAIDDAASDGWQEPSTLDALQAAATRVSLKEGARVTQNLRLVPAR